MSKRMIAHVLVLAFVAWPPATAAARDRDRDGMSDKWEKRYRVFTCEGRSRP